MTFSSVSSQQLGRYFFRSISSHPPSVRCALSRSVFDCGWWNLGEEVWSARFVEHVPWAPLQHLGAPSASTGLCPHCALSVPENSYVLKGGQTGGRPVNRPAWDGAWTQRFTLTLRKKCIWGREGQWQRPCGRRASRTGGRQRGPARDAVSWGERRTGWAGGESSWGTAADHGRSSPFTGREPSEPSFRKTFKGSLAMRTDGNRRGGTNEAKEQLGGHWDPPGETNVSYKGSRRDGWDFRWTSRLEEGCEEFRTLKNFWMEMPSAEGLILTEWVWAEAEARSPRSTLGML